MTRAAAVLLGLAAGGGCSARAVPTSCGDDLHGVYAAPEGGRWMLLDNRFPAGHAAGAAQSLEAYPLFPDAADVVAPAGIVVAPRVIDLRPAPGPSDRLAGEVLRRYMRGGDACVVRAAVHVTSCSAAGLELVLADPQAPAAFTPCEVPRGAPSRRELWTRE